MRNITTMAVAGVMGAALLAACGAKGTGATETTSVSPAGGGTPSASMSGSTSGAGESAAPTEAPVPLESSPPGDIPDTIAFVPYASKPGGFKVSTPEGWARTSAADAVTFTDKLNTVEMGWAPATSAPSVASAKSTDVPALASGTRAFTLKSVTGVTLPAGPAVLISYQANSDPNPVTGKQYRLDVLRYELFHAGKNVTMTLLSPVGADNVDPWRIVTQSLRWN